MKTEFQVEGMSCQHCVAAVTNAIREHDDGAQVQVDLAAGRVAVESTQSVEALKAAIDEAGYTVKGAVKGEVKGEVKGVSPDAASGAAGGAAS